jgi:CelD/BcsL family acetyltransferase involved in cellulose biosynthesis
MAIREIDPISDPRWRSLVERHPRASVFHTSGWLEALKRTYGYAPAVLTATPPQQALTGGVVFCRVSSWLTGRRIVSLPFSDHCDPLVNSSEELNRILAALRGELDHGWDYVEMRPVDCDPGLSDRNKSATFCSHRLDLRSSLQDLFSGLHKDCVRRKIRRASRERLTYEEGRSEAILERFYRLLGVTRRRHGVLPQPRAWFRNLMDCLGEKLQIRLALKDGNPVAGILTLRHKQTLVYKYGCSDKQFSNLGGTQMLLWNAIEEAKSGGLLEFDMGRSDWGNPGLIAFKDRWGAGRSVLTYSRYSNPTDSASQKWVRGALNRFVARVPEGFCTRASSSLYRHIG